MGVRTSNEYSEVRDQKGRWVFGIGPSESLPTSGLQEGALAWDPVDSQLLKFASGAWASAAMTTGAITGSGTSTLAALNVTAGVGVGGDLKQSVQVLTDDGAVTKKGGLVILNKAGAIAATLADPAATTDDGKVLQVLSITAQAHTLSNAAGSGFNGGGAGSDVGTFGGAIADSITLVAYGGKWYVLNNVNVTLA